MPKIVDHDARRTELLNEALPLFANAGYTGLSMRSLAAGLGVSTGTLYHYFPNKSDLFTAMMRSIAAHNIAAVLSDLVPDSSLEERAALLRAFVVANADTLRQSLWVAIDFARAEGEAASTLLGELLAGYRAALTANLAQGNEAVGANLLHLVLGILVQQGLRPGAVDIEEQLQWTTWLVPVLGTLD